jgi:hypothetical protein
MDDQRVDRNSGEIMKLLPWFAALGLLGLAMMLGGACNMFESREGATIAGGVIVGCVAISVAILAAAKN